MADLLAHNLAALRAEVPAIDALLARADAEPTPAIEPSRAGPPTARVARSDRTEIWLHSRVDPEREAGRVVDGVKLAPLATYVLLGVGLGYPLAALLERVPPGTPVVAIERSARLAREALSRWDWRRLAEGRRLLFLPGVKPDEIYPLLRGHTDSLLCGSLIYVDHPPSLAAWSEEYAALRAAVTAWVRGGAMMVQTWMALGRRMMANRLANLPAYLRSPGIAPYRGLCASCPVIVASAGPSLRRNLPLLREASGRAVVVAVSTALRVLLEHGVRPDFTAVLDYHDISRRYFEDLPPGPPIPIVASACATPAALAAHRGPPLFYEDELIPLLVPSCRGRHGALGHSGSTVAHLAASFALHLGASRVLLVGQDLSYPHGVTHVPGTAIHAEWQPRTGRFCTLETLEWEALVGQRERLVRIADADGRPLYTDQSMLLYLKEFEVLCANHPGRFVNATEGGARMQGAEHLSLAAALAKYGGIRPALPSPAGGAAAEASRADLLDTTQRLARLVAGLERLQALLRELQRVAAVAGDPAVLLAGIRETEERLAADRGLDPAIDSLDRTGDWLRERFDRELSAKTWGERERQGAQIERDRLVVESRLDAARALQEMVAGAMAALDALLRGVLPL